MWPFKNNAWTEDNIRALIKKHLPTHHLSRTGKGTGRRKKVVVKPFEEMTAEDRDMKR